MGAPGPMNVLRFIAADLTPSTFLPAETAECRCRFHRYSDNELYSVSLALDVATAQTNGVTDNVQDEVD